MGNKLAALDALAKAVPGLNEEATKRAQAAAQVQLQAQLGGAPRQVNVTQAAQQAAPQAVLQQAQINQAAQQHTNQTLQGLGNQALQQKAFDDQQSVSQQATQQAADLAGREQRQGLNLQRETLASRKVQTQKDIQTQRVLQKFGLDKDAELQSVTLKQKQDLARLGNDLEGKLLDSRLTFERDDAGRKFSNDRQLADWTIMNAKTEQEAALKLQAMQQEAEKKIKLLEIAHQGILDTIEQGYISKKGDLDQAHKKNLLQIQKALEEKIRREQSAAANRAAIWQAGGAILGAAGGAMIGSPTLGMAIGSGLGTLAGGATA